MKLERTKKFKQDYKRESKGRHRKTIDESFIEILKLLLKNKPLAEKYKDHALTDDTTSLTDFLLGEHTGDNLFPDLVSFT